jgi:VWFA-related protein
MSRRLVLGLATVLLLGLTFSGQELQHVVSVVNIEIPVRVFKGDVFVDSLTIDDFEVLEDGKPQKIEAVYLVKKTDIKRAEGQKGLAPKVSREFVLFFEMMEYLPELDIALDHFFNQVILPGDDLIVITPMNRYHLRGEAYAKIAATAIKDQLRSKLRRDILMGSSEYANTLRDLELALSSDDTLEEKVQLYSMILAKLEQLRKVDERGLIAFADFLKSSPGQKFVYLFYQKERIPKFDERQMTQIMMENQSNPALVLKLMENFQFFKRDVDFNVDAVKKAYADSSIAIHFLFLTKTPAIPTSITSSGPSGLALVEQSEDIFSAFNEIAAATGGISESSANAAAAFDKAVEASENYYLIYYIPRNYAADGRFHEIKVRVKTGGYSVSHRAGYLAK